MSRVVRSILIVLFLIVVLGPLSAQTRIAAPPEARGLPAKDRKFTTHDRQRETDTKGLRHSEFMGEHHAVGGYVYGGYSTSLASTDAVAHQPGGGDFRIGGAYEYRHGYFILQTGLGISYRTIRINSADYQYTNADLSRLGDGRWNTVIDTWEMPLKSLTYIVEGRVDRLHRLAVQLPVLAGVNFNGLYLLAGFNFSFPVWQKASAKMDITSRGSYARYYGFEDEHYWQEMDNHGYRKQVPMEYQFKSLKSLIDIQLCGEVGYDWSFQKDIHFRVAGFVSYGLLNEARNASGKSLDIPYESKWDFGTFGATPIWYSDRARGKQVHDLSVGIKVTVLFMFRQPDKCVLCGLRGRR